MCLRNLQYLEVAPDTVPAGERHTLTIDASSLPPGMTMISAGWELLGPDLVVMEQGPAGSGPTGTYAPYGWYVSIQNNGETDQEAQLLGLLASY